jgi:hypothetical protein
MPPVIVFDVNETLLDLQAMDPALERVFGGASVRQQWFPQLLSPAMVSSEAAARVVALGAAGGGRVEEDERVIGQVFEREANHVARARESGVGVSNLPFGLKAARP